MIGVVSAAFGGAIQRPKTPTYDLIDDKLVTPNNFPGDDRHVGVDITDREKIPIKAAI